MLRTTAQNCTNCGRFQRLPIERHVCPRAAPFLEQHRSVSWLSSALLSLHAHGLLLLSRIQEKKGSLRPAPWRPVPSEYVLKEASSASLQSSTPTHQRSPLANSSQCSFFTATWVYPVYSCMYFLRLLTECRFPEDWDSFYPAHG